MLKKILEKFIIDLSTQIFNPEKERELRQSKQNWQKTAKESNELSRQVNKLKNELTSTTSQLAEKDGLALTLEEKFQNHVYIFKFWHILHSFFGTFYSRNFGIFCKEIQLKLRL